MEPRSTKLIKSPLRYPGGKQRLARTLVYMLPQDIKEYREPFVGGGHVFVLLRQARPDVKVWINDNNPDLIAFWRQAQKDSEALTRRILPFVDVENKRDLFHALKNQTVDGEEDRAVRFSSLTVLHTEEIINIHPFHRLQTDLTKTMFLRLRRLAAF